MILIWNLCFEFFFYIIRCAFELAFLKLRCFKCLRNKRTLSNSSQKWNLRKKKYEQAIDLCNSQNISLSHQTKNLQYEVLWGFAQTNVLIKLVSLSYDNQVKLWFLVVSAFPPLSPRYIQTLVVTVLIVLSRFGQTLCFIIGILSYVMVSYI